MEMKKVFHELSKKEQNEIRRKYKDEWSKDYKTSIRLYVVYVIVGILALLGVGIMYFVGFMLGLVLFLGCFVLMFVIIYLLKKSNQRFFAFLDSLDMIYDRQDIKK